MAGNRKRISLWMDDTESPSSKVRKLDHSGRQTSSELQVPAGISRTLLEESDNGSRDIIIIDSDTEEASFS